MGKVHHIGTCDSDKVHLLENINANKDAVLYAVNHGRILKVNNNAYVGKRRGDYADRDVHGTIRDALGYEPDKNKLTEEDRKILKRLLKKAEAYSTSQHQAKKANA